jgi:hypothetical protein
LLEDWRRRTTFAAAAIIDGIRHEEMTVQASIYETQKAAGERFPVRCLLIADFFA